jgi:hypothetical protein
MFLKKCPYAVYRAFAAHTAHNVASRKEITTLEEVFMAVRMKRPRIRAFTFALIARPEA